MSNAMVKLTSVKVNDPNHVGQAREWYYVANINNIGIKSTEEKSVIIVNDELSFYLEAYEKDKVIDKGTLSKKYKYIDLQNKSIKLDVIVTENRGQYAGNKATVSFSFEIR